MLKPFDDHNHELFENHKDIGYICSMCGCFCDSNDSISFKGYNLVCDRCIEKLTCVFNTSTYAIRAQIQHVGRKRLEAVSDQKEEEDE